MLMQPWNPELIKLRNPLHRTSDPLDAKGILRLRLPLVI
jgi:hypothetical protein